MAKKHRNSTTMPRTVTRRTVNATFIDPDLADKELFKSQTVDELFSSEEGEDYIPFMLASMARDFSEETGLTITPERIVIAAVHLLLFGQDENGHSHSDSFAADPHGIRYRTLTEEEDLLFYPTEMPKLEEIPGWNELGEEKQEWLREHTQNLIRFGRLAQIERGILSAPSGRPQ